MHPLQLTGRAWGHQFVNWNSAQAHGAIGTADRGGVSPNVCGGCHCENSRNNAKFKTQVACVKAPLRFLAEHGAVLNVKTAPTAMAHGWPLRTRRSRARARAPASARALARAHVHARGARAAQQRRATPSAGAHGFLLQTVGGNPPLSVGAPLWTLPKAFGGAQEGPKRATKRDAAASRSVALL